VKLFWTWANWLTEQTPDELRPLYINMDETSLPMGFVSLRGNIIAGARKRIGAGPGHDPLPSGQRKGAMSLVAFISSDPALQKILPQFLIGNNFKLTKGCMNALREMDAQNLVIWSEKSGWVNHQVMARMLKTLRQRLTPHVGRRQVILVLDVARSHISSALTNYACRLHMWLMFVPRRLTWLLQPLDVCVFRTFKAAYRRRYTTARSMKIGGMLSTVEWVHVIRDVVQEIFSERTWARAFEVTGILGQSQVSTWIRQHADFTERRCVGRELTQDEVQSLGGKRITMPWEELMRGPRMRRTGALAALAARLAIANRPAVEQPASTLAGQTASASSGGLGGQQIAPTAGERRTPGTSSSRQGPPIGYRLGLSQSQMATLHGDSAAATAATSSMRPITRSRSRLMQEETTAAPKRRCSHETR